MMKIYHATLLIFLSNDIINKHVTYIKNNKYMIEHQRRVRKF